MRWVFIKIKVFTLTIAVILIGCLFLTVLNVVVRAEDEHAEISIKGNPTYELVSQDTTATKTISRYLINITLVNTGTIKSEEIEVNLTDEEGFILTHSYFLNAGEEKTVTFNWSTIQTINQNIVIMYYPKNLDTEWTRYNSGTTSFTLKMTEDENNTKSTPGFEILTLIIAMIISAFYLKQRPK